MQMTRPDQDYERFVQKVCQMLLKAEGKHTTKVERDVKLRGVSGQEHQIDVCWEYQQIGITYQTAVECKCYKRKVNIGKVRDFSGVLSDVPNLRGIFATRSGYQSGAVKFAKARGIELRIIREPEEQDYDWKFLNIKYLAPYANVLWEKFHVIADLDWYKAQGLHPKDTKISGYGDGTDVFLEDRLTGKRKTMLDIQKELSTSAQNLTLGEQYCWIFPDVNENFENTWLHFSEDNSMEPVKIHQLHVYYVVEKGFWVIEMEQATHNHHVVVKDALRDEHTFYDKEGKETGKKFRY